MADEDQQRVTLEDYSSSSVSQFFASIVRPEVQAHNINYPHSLIHLIQGNLFHGLPNEDPYVHLATYIEICNIVKIVGVPDEAIRLSLFSFSLAGEAKKWLHSFKDTSAGGKIKLKTPEEATELIENISASDHVILRDRVHQRTEKSLLDLSSQDTMLVMGCTICGGAHESGHCIPFEEQTQEVSYMGNQQRQGYNLGGFSGFQQGPYNQQGQWRSHPGNQFNKDQGGPSNRPPQQGPNIF
ncbi:uncharacterized protein [Glycine max]|uniref:uncharacterized protein n=1 Tax=Glycine max TaxID=3847 RepID=UPI000E21BECC|nr:uncharacterized protein LOC113001416 [Glycine max]|eukprot:XP_025983891.1 uncharacterized protein LOC113001416 [Glycine max]